ncbi:MAG: HK97 family phage prohead protease, partial [Burkholderiales bacterium]
ESGAFKKTINENKKRIKVLWQHNTYEPIGLPLVMEEDSKGLYVKAKIVDTDVGKKAMTLLREGVINEMSIGYNVIKDEWDNEKKIRYLKEVKLWEFSLVTFGANDKAKVTGVKELDFILDELKAGRMISNSNRGKIQAVIDSLTALLEVDEPSEDTQEAEKSLNDIEDIDPNLFQLISEELKQYKKI